MKGLYVLKEKRIYKRELPLWGSLLAAVLLAGCITLLALWCQPNALRTVLAGFKAQPLLIVLNALPIGLLLLAFAFLFRNVFYSGALVNFFVCALSLANRVKIEVRDEPVFPRDFSLLREVGSAIQSYDIRYPVKAIAVVVLTTALLIGLGVLFPSRPVSFAALKAKLTKRDAVAVFPGRCWPERILGAVLSFGVLTALIFTVYASNTLYNSFRVSNAYYVPSVFNELGFPYCFCHQFTTYPVDKPEGFSKSEAAGWETGGQTGLGKDISVILVMNEAFSDLTVQPMFNWTEETDPLPNLHALQKDPHTLSGHIVVPGFAGGTANTEFDVLTGMQTNALSVTATSAMRVVNRNLDSLFRVFGADGYRTSFYHPGDAWFYNRENVYRWLGAEHEVFAKDMKNLEYKGRWVTDDYMAGLIEQEFADTVAAGETLFHYTTTIQNHMSYTADKYGADYEKQLDYITKQRLAAIDIKNITAASAISETELKRLDDSFKKEFGSDYVRRREAYGRIMEFYAAIKQKAANLSPADYEKLSAKVLPVLFKNPIEALRLFEEQALARHNFLTKQYPSAYGDLRKDIEDIYPDDFAMQLKELDARLDAANSKGKPMVWNAGGKNPTTPLSKEYFSKYI